MRKETELVVEVPDGHRAAFRAVIPSIPVERGGASRKWSWPSTRCCPGGGGALPELQALPRMQAL